MTSVTFINHRSAKPYSPAAQQLPRMRRIYAAHANSNNAVTVSPAMRGIVFGLLVSAPLWAIIVGSAWLAFTAMG